MNKFWYTINGQNIINIYCDENFANNINKIIDLFYEKNIPFWQEAINSKYVAYNINSIINTWLRNSESPYNGFSNLFYEISGIKINIDDILNEHKKYINYCPGFDVLKTILFYIAKNNLIDTSLIYLDN